VSDLPTAGASRVVTRRPGASSSLRAGVGKRSDESLGRFGRDAANSRPGHFPSGGAAAVHRRSVGQLRRIKIFALNVGATRCTEPLPTSPACRLASRLLISSGPAAVCGFLSVRVPFERKLKQSGSLLTRSPRRRDCPLLRRLRRRLQMIATHPSDAPPAPLSMPAQGVEARPAHLTTSAIRGRMRNSRYTSSPAVPVHHREGRYPPNCDVHGGDPLCPVYVESPAKRTEHRS
jgi:hypothetical protein